VKSPNVHIHTLYIIHLLTKVLTMSWFQLRTSFYSLVLLVFLVKGLNAVYSLLQ